MDATQVLDDFDEEEFNYSGSKKTVAFLKVQAVGEFPETSFPVYEGENIIGRHDSCDITIPLQAVSKKHACIDVHGKNHLICDYNSRNKTQRKQMFLKPQAFYELVHEVELMFADIKCQYLFAQTKDVVEKDTVSDSGSETASESMMPQSTEDDEEPEEDPKEEKLTASAKSEKLAESMEQYLDQPTQDYSYKNPDGNSPVFCAETDDDETDDDETDDERGGKEGAPADIGSSFNKEQTVRYSSEGTETDPTIDATLVCNTLPSTLEPDTIPATPFTQTNDFEPPFKLKRSVDVKIDTSRRVSAGNTLAYGLSTLESPNSTRESMDVSESESVKEDLSGEGTSTTQVKNKLLFDHTADQRSSDNKEKRLPDSMSMQDEILDDLLATQLYEPMEIPESPEFLQHDSDVDEPVDESTKITENGAPESKMSEGEISQGINPADEISVGQISQGKSSERIISERKTSEDNTSEDKISQDKISEDKSSEGRISEGTVSEDQTLKCKTSGDNISEDKTFSEDKTESKIFEDKVFDDTVETQAYGLDTLAQDEDMATQAYGLTLDASDHGSDTGDELATQAYGDDIEVPKVSNVFKVPGAMNTQELNEDELGNIVRRDESAANNETVGNEEHDDEMDIQPTQNYIENQVRESGETSESSDNFPSFASFMGLKTDSDSDFMSAKESSRKKVVPKIPLQSSTPAAVNKSSSIIIEGENALSTEKRCYVECPGVEDKISQDKEHDDKPSARKKSLRGRKKSTATRAKVQDETMADTTELSTTQSKHDEPTRSTRNDTVVREDTGEQRETIVVKRGKGRSTRSKRSVATTRNSRGKINEMIADEIEGDVAEEAVVESLPKARRSTRKRKSSEVNAKTESKNEGESSVVKVDVENMKTECKEGKLNMSDNEEDNDIFKLQISAVDSPETDDFIPKKKAVLEKKRQRGKKGMKEVLESNDESETTNIEVEKQPYPRAKGSVSAKSTRKGRGKKNQEVSEVDSNENNPVSGQAEIKSSDNSGQRPDQQKGSMVKSTRKGRGKKNQEVSEVDSNENITVSGQAEIKSSDGSGQRPDQQKGSMVKSTKKGRGKTNQEVSEVDSNENITVSGQAEIMSSDNNGQRPDQQKGSMVKSTKKGRAKKCQTLPEFAGIEDIAEDVVKQDNMVESNPDSNTQQKDTVVKSVEAVEQELPDAMTPVVNTSRTGRKGRLSATKTVKNGASKSVEQNLEEVQNKNENEVDEQENNTIETKMKEAKTPAKGRSRKRKSFENSNENTQQRKGTAKKSRKNETAEENLEMKKEDETQEDIKFESEERVLTPRRSLSKRSSSSSTNLSRSAMKGKKQEKEDSEGSNDHSSNVKIIFTGLQDNAFIKAKKIVQTLGGQVVERLEDCTHLVTDKVRRTVKLLCAVSRGIPVVDMSWLDASKKSKSFVDSSGFILKDKEAQKKFNFSMETSLERSQNAGLLDGYKIHVTPHVRPPPDDMKEIIKSAKGEIISKMPTSRDNDVIVLSCDEDTKMCQKAHIEKVYTAELLLTGILRQELDLEQHKLILNATSVVDSSPVKSKGRRRR